MRFSVVFLPVIIGMWVALPVSATEDVKPLSPQLPRPVVSEIIGGSAEVVHNYIGTVTTQTEVKLGFPVSGTIASRPVKLGDTVVRGDILAQLDPEALEASVWAARAGVVVAEQQLSSADAVLERERTLVARGVESRTRQEDAERAFASATARLEQANATLARAEDTLSSTTLRAPQDGVITETLVESGAAVSAGQPIVQLASFSEREVVVDLGDTDLAQLPRDVPFVARLLAVPQARAVLHLHSIDPVADRRTRTRRVHFAMESPSEEFRIGALVRVTPPPNGAGVVTVPTSAIMTDADQATAVWVVTRPAGIVHKTAIILGEVLGERAIVSYGLELRQEIVIKGIHSLKDGQTVGPRVTK